VYNGNKRKVTNLVRIVPTPYTRVCFVRDLIDAEILQLPFI